MEKFKYLLLLLCLAPVLTLFTGCFSPDYKIYIKNPGSEISITASKKSADKGEMITLSHTLINDCYEFSHYLINGVELKGNTFEMPEKNVEVSAVVKKVKYQINYHLGENETANNVTLYKETDSEIYLSDAQKDGFLFAGWFTSPNFSGDRITKIIPSEKKDYNLYPKFVSFQVEGEYRLINSVVDFLTIIDENNLGKFKIVKDLDFSGFITNGLCGDLAFQGEIDGNNKVLSNITIKNVEGQQDVGLFRKISGAKIYNLTIKDSYLEAVNDGGINAGGLAGLNSSSLGSTIENVVIDNFDIKCSGNALDVGSLVGVTDRTKIISCTVKNSSLDLNSSFISAGSMVGTANFNTEISKSRVLYNSEDIKMVAKNGINFGGIVGNTGFKEPAVKIENCYVSQTKNSKIDVFLDYPHNTHVFLAKVGGIIGNINYKSSIKNCYVNLYKINIIEEEMTNSQRHFGGIVGFGDDFDSVIENCFVTAVNVNGSKSVFLSDVDYVGSLFGLCAITSTNNFVDSGVNFLLGVKINNDFIDKTKVSKAELSEIKSALNWDEEVWNLTGELPTLDKAQKPEGGESENPETPESPETPENPENPETPENPGWSGDQDNIIQL